MILKKEIRTQTHEEIIDITTIISQEASKHNIQEGNIIIFIPHTTAGVTINENADPDVKRDILAGLSCMGYESLQFAHREGNSPAHIKASLIGSSVTLIINNNRLLLGSWQGVYFCEFDGPRNREFVIQVNKIS